jgi:recombination protein RecT
MTAAAQTQMVPLKERYIGMQAVLEKNRGAITQACTKHLDAGRLSRLALTELRKTPDLLLCTPVSVVASVMQAAQLGLEIGGPLGRAYLVPFNNKKARTKECQLVIGYKGMIELALRSGMVETVEGYAVYEGDHFDYELGLNRRLSHQPYGEDDPAKLTHAYAIVRYRGGGVLFAVLTRKAIEARRRQSPGAERGPWVEHFAEMAIKTAIRWIFKYTPASPELSRAVSFEEQAEAGISPTEVIDADLVATIDAEGADATEERKGALDKLVDKERAKKPATPTIKVRGVDGQLINTGDSDDVIDGQVVDAADAAKEPDRRSEDGEAARV